MGDIVKAIEHPGGYTIIPIHHSMDPERDEKWFAETRPRYSDDDWNKEQELDFRSVKGTPAYPKFSKIANVRLSSEILYSRHLPIILCCDFNVDPMTWVICQIKDDMVYVINEIYLKPGDVETACQRFIEYYPDHGADVIVYGDATGRARSQQNQRSNYDEIKIQFSKMPFNLVFRVPVYNPPPLNRIKAVNMKLKNVDGEPGILISDTCTQLIKDLEEVVLNDGGKDVLKVKKKDDQYYYRTHISDALGYFIVMKYPTMALVRKETAGDKSKPRPRAKPPKGKKKKFLGVIRK